MQLWQKLEFRNPSLPGQTHHSVLMESSATQNLAVGAQRSAPSGHVLAWVSNISSPEKFPK